MKKEAAVSQWINGCLDILNKSKSVNWDIFSCKNRLNDTRDRYQQLQRVYSLPSSVEAAVVELQRRLVFGDRYTEAVKRTQGVIDQMRCVENQRRLAFSEKHMPNLPQSIFGALKEEVPHVEITVPPFDSTLVKVPMEILKSSTNKRRPSEDATDGPTNDHKVVSDELGLLLHMERGGKGGGKYEVARAWPGGIQG
eukprot:GHVO01062931.1.p1 GENE.GHVO01062931.1~~GHVO01062931.1.p1  ORF type:complete len:196 (-),score=33.07 GHVO01062931.1:149-736(-)